MCWTMLTVLLPWQHFPITRCIKKRGKENRHLFRHGHTAPARGSLAVGWTAFKNRHQLTDCTRVPPGGCGRYTRVSSWGWSYVTVYFFWGTRRQKDNQLNQSCLNLLSLMALEISDWQKGPAMAPITGRFLKLSSEDGVIYHERTNVSYNPNPSDNNPFHDKWTTSIYWQDAAERFRKLLKFGLSLIVF